MTVRVRRLHRDERGSGLVEALVASALVGVALVGLVGSLSTFAMASRDALDVEEAQGVARSQAARLKAAPYRADGDYAAYLEPLAAGISRTIDVTWWDGAGGWSSTQNANGLQLIELVIAVDGAPATTLELAKADR